MQRSLERLYFLCVEVILAVAAKRVAEEGDFVGGARAVVLLACYEVLQPLVAVFSIRRLDEALAEGVEVVKCEILEFSAEDCGVGNCSAAANKS